MSVRSGGQQWEEVMHQRKILHLRSTNGFYGAENVIWQLTRLQKETAQVMVASFVDASGDNALLQRLRESGVSTVALAGAGRISWQVIRKLRRFIISEKVTVLHTHDYKSTIIGLLAARMLPLAKICTNHAWDAIDRKLWWYQRLEGLCYNFFDRIVAVSITVAADVRPFLWRRDKVTVIANGIDCHDFADTAQPPVAMVQTHSGKSSNTFTLGLIGRFTVEKGHRYLIQAMPEILSAIPGTQVFFWGSGELEDTLRQQVSQAGLAERIHFAGVSREMAAVYRSLDLLVMPSLSEGLPMTLLEAMAAGTPVLVTPVGDIPRVISDEESGFFVEPGNCQQLVKKIIAIHDDPAKRARFAERGRQIVAERFSAAAMARQYDVIYDTCSVH